MDTHLVVKGFGASLLKLNGQYEKGSTNCGRPTYKKTDRNGSSCIYYWDKDDGMKGWWIAPKVNGDEVWARHSSSGNLPPRQGWFAPWESKVADKNIIVAFATANGTGKRPMPPTAIPAKKLKTEEEVQEMFGKVTEGLEEIKRSISPCVDLVDKLKDSAVMFTCEVVDHMPPDDVLETKAKADAAGKEAQEEISKIRKLYDTARMQNEQCRSLGEYTEIRSKLDGFAKKIQEMNRDVSKNLSDVSRGSQKAVQAKREEKQLAAQKMQRLAAQKVIAFQIIAKPIKAAVGDMKSVKEIRDAESVVLAMMEVITKDTPIVQGSASQHVFRATSGSLKILLKQLQDKRKDIHLAESARVDELGTILARAIQEYMEREKMDEDALFARIAQKELTGAQLEAFADSLEFEYTKELLSSLFGRAVAACGKIGKVESLTKDEFFMYIAHTLYSTCSDAVMEEDDGQKKKVESGDIIEVIEGPVGEPLKVRCKLMDGVIGWMPFKALQRMAPQFSVVQETVLTDRHELKGFNVLTRLRPGMKLLAEKLPMVDPTTKLLRVPVKLVAEEGVESLSGFVTVKGNRGAQLLKQDAAAPADFGESQVSPKELTDDDWAKMVSEHTSSVVSELVAGIEEITGLKAECEQKCVNLEALSDGWTAEVLEETSKAAVDAWEKIDSLIQALANKLAVQHKELGSVCSKVGGPLSDVKATVDDVQKRLLEAKSAHFECSKRARVANKKLMHELSQQKWKVERAAEEEIVSTYVNESIGRKELVIGMQSRIDVVAEDEAGLLAFQETLASAEEMITTMRQWMDTTRKECQGMAAKKVELGKSVGELSASLSKLNVLLNTRKTQLTGMWIGLVEKGAILCAKALREHMEMTKIAEADLFAQLTKESGGVLKVQALRDLLIAQKVELSASIIEKIFQKIASKGSEELTQHQFSFLTKAHYKVVKATTLTDSLSIKSGVKVCSLSVDETVLVLSPAETDESTGVSRVRVAYGDKEGYVTLKGNQGSVFLEPQTFYYKVTKETLMTNKFQMQDFQPVRRLKIGDILRARSVPLEEKASNLWRVEVVALFPQDAAKNALLSENCGFATVKGNQGTPFLESVSIEGQDLEEPSGEAEKDVAMES